MTNRKLKEGQKIPVTLTGGFHLISRSEELSEIKKNVKRLNKPMSKLKLIKYQIEKKPGAFDWIFGKSKPKSIYILYTKD